MAIESSDLSSREKLLSSLAEGWLESTKLMLPDCCILALSMNPLLQDPRALTQVQLPSSSQYFGLHVLYSALHIAEAAAVFVTHHKRKKLEKQLLPS